MSGEYKVSNIYITSPSAAQHTLSKELADYEAIAKKAKELVQTLVKEGKLPPESLKQLYAGTLQLQVQGNRFAILNTGGKVILSSTTEDKKSSRVAKEITSIAKSYLAPSSSTTKIASPHSMENGKYYCYANSAYQLLGNIPSLQKSVLADLPDSLKDLKDYSKMQKGSTLIDTWNHSAAPQAQFDVNKGQMASEFLELLVGKCPRYPFVNLTTVHTRKDPIHHDKIVSSSEPQGFVGLNTTQEGPFIDFTTALATALHTQTDPSTVDNEEVIDSRSFFEKNPSQLFIKIDRFKKGTKDQRAVKNIPMVLDTAPLVKEGTESTQLELKGFVVHTGAGLGHVGGHYTSYIKIEDAKNPGRYHWIHTDDAKTPCIITTEELEKALEGASDLYYDNELLKPKVLSNTFDDIIYYIDHKQEFVDTEAEGEESLYTKLLNWAFETKISQEEQDRIACSLAKERQSVFEKLLEIPLTYGLRYIQQHPEDPFFKELLKEALTRKRDNLLSL